MNDGSADASSGSQSVRDLVEGGTGSQSVGPLLTNVSRMDAGNIQRLLSEIGYLVVELGDQRTRNKFYGNFVQILEILKGNRLSNAAQSLENILHTHMSMFTRLSNSNKDSISNFFERAVREVGSGESDDMIRGGPPLPNNHGKNIIKNLPMSE
jgi:hypothetical protein